MRNICMSKRVDECTWIAINQPFLFCFFERADGGSLVRAVFLIVVARGGLPRPARAGLAMTFAMSPEQDARVGARKGRGKASGRK